MAGRSETGVDRTKQEIAARRLSTASTPWEGWQGVRKAEEDPQDGPSHFVVHQAEREAYR